MDTVLQGNKLTISKKFWIIGNSFKINNFERASFESFFQA